MDRCAISVFLEGSVCARHCGKCHGKLLRIIIVCAHLPGAHSLVNLFEKDKVLPKLRDLRCIVIASMIFVCVHVDVILGCSGGTLPTAGVRVPSFLCTSLLGSQFRTPHDGASINKGYHK